MLLLSPTGRKEGIPMKIADSHAHIFPLPLAQKATESISHFYEIPMTNIASSDVLLQEEKEAGISVTLVCNSAVTASQVPSINRFIASQCAEHSEFVGLGSVFPGMDGWEEELDTICAFGLRGIKIHSDFQKVDIDDPTALDLYKACAEKGLVVLFHMGDNRYDYSHPRRLLHLKQLIPDLTAIAAHFGGYQAWDAVLDSPLPDGIYFDTSSSLMFLAPERARAIMNKFGTHRFLFGTDFPMWTPKMELERFLNCPLGLTQAEKEDILYHNFEKLFQLI